MSVATAPHGAGSLLREWRERRRMSQLDLSVEAEVSTRHLSFVETGRSKASRELLLHLADRLEVPLRERNALLLAAGYAPVYRETSLDADELGPVRAALDKILAGHDPYPAVVVDRRWNVVAANDAAFRTFTTGLPPELLAPPLNALRVSLHPEGLAPRIVNLAEYSAHLLARLQRELAVSADPAVAALLDELRAYPGVVEEGRDSGRGDPDAASLLFVPLVLRSADGGPDLTFFSTIATFGTALDITVAELAIESFFPADEATATALRAT
jgi:transcriptional regulator with XRE-family HTH domain